MSEQLKQKLNPKKNNLKESTTDSQTTIPFKQRQKQHQIPTPKITQTELTKTQNLVILFSIVFANVGFWSINDFPQSLADPLIDHFKVTTEDMGLLYSVSSSISIFMAPLAGILIAKKGIGNLAMVFSGLIAFGAFVMYFGVKTEFFSILVLGRAIFSLGAEAVLIAQAAASEKWFSGKFLSFSMGLNLSSGLLSASLSNFLNPMDVVKQRSLEAAFFYYVCMASFSFFSLSVFCLMDWKYDHILSLAAIKKNTKVDNPSEQGAPPKIDSQEIKPANGIDTPPKNDSEEEKGVSGLDAPPQSYKFKLSDLGKLGTMYWCSVAIYTLASNTYYQFTFIITNTAVHRYHYPYLDAKNFLPIIQLLSAIFMPINSLLILKIGKKPTVIFSAVCMLFLSYVNLVLTPPGDPLRFQISIGMMAYFYITYQSTIYPCIALSLPRDAVSVGFGFASLVQGIPTSSMALVLSSMIKNETQGEFQTVLYILLGNAAFCVFLLYVVVRLDRKHGRLLDAPENSEIARKAREVVNLRFRERSMGVGKKGKEVVTRRSHVTVGTIKASSEMDGRSVGGSKASLIRDNSDGERVRQGSTNQEEIEDALN